MNETNIRLKAFEWLEEQTNIHGDVLPRNILAEGFIFKSERIPLVSPQGIFKPRMLEYPLTITTTPKGPYEDSFSKDGFLLYRYRGTDPNYSDNVGLRKANEKGMPLIYFHGIIPGKYLAVWPVFIVADDPIQLTFKVAVDDKSQLKTLKYAVDPDSVYRRAYITSMIKVRLHQRSFRERVLDAYRSQCALCRLKHNELLDAAHIIPDSDPESKLTVDNGIALCKLHHAAFDSFIIGITPDYDIEIRKDVLEEIDGPMLKHGLIELHKTKIILPKNKILRPNPDYLDIRYKKFKNTG